MKEFVLAFGAGFGALAVMLGAFGAHALKKTLSEELLKSFETGVKYQMYHALVLLIIGFNFTFHSSLEKTMAWFFIIGVLLFSFSIYALCLGKSKNKKVSFLGPITPLGGLLLLGGWCLLFIKFL